MEKAVNMDRKILKGLKSKIMLYKIKGQMSYLPFNTLDKNCLGYL